MPAAGSYSSTKEDPRRPNKIFRYKPVTNKPTDDPTPEYMNLLGMIFSMCGLLMKLKWAAWAAVYCSFITFSNSRSSEDTKQMFSSFLLSVSAVVMSYLQNPQPMASTW
ncbi:PAT complex subunit Asterix-like [Montipora capricornis]|uniref:PAT complex subunit Asterix-like n=1 Tax=Montipora foliosa TaxID=591990 RepID=UPI0035F2158B